MKKEYCIIEVNTMSLYSYMKEADEETAKSKLTDAYNRKEEDTQTWAKNCELYPNTPAFENYLKEAQNKEYIIMTWDEYEESQKTYWINKPVTEITKENFHEMLNVLPPIKWCTIDNVEMFCMSEFLTGVYTSQYAHDKKNDKYYHKTVSVFDQKTWIHNFL